MHAEYVNRFSMKIYTIGHSNHSQAEFLHLLEMHGVNSIVDVRSVPASSHSPQFNQDALEGYLRIHNVDYLFFGKEFGARRFDSIGENGQVDFEKAVHTELFQEGVKKLLLVLKQKNVSLMCSEADPLECHRFAFLARYFHEHGFEVWHILKDATIVSHYDLEQRMINLYLHAKRPKLPEIDELFGTYTVEDQLYDAYRLKNKEIGFRVEQEEYLD